MIREGRPLSVDIETVAAMMSDGGLVEAIEAAVGPLA